VLSTGTCAVGTPVAAGGSCTVVVQFADPTAGSVTTGTLTVSGTGVGTGAPAYSATRNLTGS